jgi:hypothetical protein
LRFQERCLALVLAVGRLCTQRRIADEITRQFSGHEIIIDALTADAFARVGSRVPDLVIFPSLFPSEQAALFARLGQWSNQEPGDALPIVSSASDAQWSYWFRTPEARQLVSVAGAGPTEDVVAAMEQWEGVAPAPRPLSAGAVGAPLPSQVAAPPRRPAVAASHPAPVVVASPTPPFSREHDFSAESDDVPVKTRRSTAPRVRELSAGLSGVVARVRALAAASATRLRMLCGLIVARIAALSLAIARGLRRGGGQAFSGLYKACLAVWRKVAGLASSVKSKASAIEMPSEDVRRYAIMFAGAALVATVAIVGASGLVRQVGSTLSTTPAKKPAEASAVNVPPPAPSGSNRGRLSVVSDPPGATVSVDGQRKGVTPLSVEDVSVGQHSVTLDHENGSVTQSVRVKAGDVATVNVPIFMGWVAVFAPFEVQVLDGGRPVGLDEQNRVMLSPGRHELQLISKPFNYRGTQTVVVRPGEVTTASIVPPKSSSVITSNPPAELWVDGKQVGYTPLVNFGIEIGTREFVFKNSLGERRVTTIVTAKPLRLHVDFTKPDQ